MMCYLIFSFNFRSLLGPIIAYYAYVHPYFPCLYLPSVSLNDICLMSPPL